MLISTVSIISIVEGLNLGSLIYFLQIVKEIWVCYHFYLVLCNLAVMCIVANKSLNMSLHVFNLHVVSVDQDLDFCLVLILNRSMGILKFLNSINDAFIRHIDIS